MGVKHPPMTGQYLANPDRIQPPQMDQETAPDLGQQNQDTYRDPQQQQNQKLNFLLMM